MARFRDPLAALNHLLDKAEGNPERVRLLAYPDYQNMQSEDERATFHRVIEAAISQGAITAKRDPRAGPADIRHVAMADPSALFAFLRREPASQSSARSIEVIRSEVGPLPAWIDAVVEELASGWALRRAPFPSLLSGDIVNSVRFVRILLAVERGDHLRGWDMRTFSRRACGDSKAVERMQSSLLRALKRKFALPDVRPRDALATLGIEKFPQPILIRATLRLPDGTEARARPYLGLPPEWARKVGLIGTNPAYLLIIENLASFNRHAREIEDPGIILYSGGFPSRAVLSAIQHLDSLLEPSVPFFHWGDNDRAGLMILEHITNAITRPIKKHLMASQLGNEQEELDPLSPLQS